MKLAECCRQYLTACKHTKRLSLHTLRAYERDLEHLSQFLKPETKISQIDKKTLKSLIYWLNQGELSQSSIKRRLACLKAMFRWLELEDLLETNPFHKLEVKVKLPHRLPRNIPRQELANLLRCAKLNAGLPFKKRYSQPLILRTIQRKNQLNALTALVALELMIATGIRVGELVSIELEQIFWSEGKIRILGKGHHERYVFMPDRELISLVKSYQQLRKLSHPNHSTLLVNSRGTPASTQFIRKLISQLAENSNLNRHVTPHMFRHSAACELLESGVDIRFVQRLLGHYSISTTELYTHVTDNVLQEQITKANVRGGLG
ncbi:MAG: tyrosine-type recombinase/integrase [Amphritea sp.]|nr:tyrosine-type recombinase/integrase [Amphritea sp.]